MISSDRFLPSKEDPGAGYCPWQGQNHLQNSHVFIFPSATILKRLDSMLGRSLAPGEPPFVNSLYIPNSIKVALGIGQLRIGKLLFGGHSSKALHCVPYAQMPSAQLPKQPLLN